jgi:hypothetical protein
MPRDPENPLTFDTLYASPIVGGRDYRRRAAARGANTSDAKEANLWLCARSR